MAVKVHSGNINEEDYSISGKVRVSRTIANFCIFSFQTLPKKYTKWQSMCTVVTTTKTTTSINGKVCVSRTIALLLDNEYAIPNLPSEIPSPRYVSLR